MSDETIANGPTINGKPTPTPDAPRADGPRRRGRPPGSKNRETLAETPIDGSGPKRGRPRKVHIELNPEAFARQIKGVHGSVAFMTGLHELIINDDEAKELAAAFVNFSREFNFEPNPKIMATLELVGVAGVIYAPRAIHIALRIKKAKAQRGGEAAGGAATGGQTIDGTAQPVETPANGAKSAVN